jgi:hypothetical protein
MMARTSCRPAAPKDSSATELMAVGMTTQQMICVKPTIERYSSPNRIGMSGDRR